MARYVVHVQSPCEPGEAFDFMADLTNFADWDPGVIEASQVVGEQPEQDAAFDVMVKAIPRPLVLRYQLVTFDRPTTVVARAQTPLLTSLDRITVTQADEGCIVTYDAELTLNGPLGLADPLVGLAFKRIGDRAADGLVRALEGRKVEAPAA
ncbi:MAG: SRPBCC family protein [Acidimicrobiia bacterium]|nr:SRPBCC family protein [Acidimicrobiia bacterium]